MLTDQDKDKRESLGHKLLHSRAGCFGIVVATILILMLAAVLTVPSKETMTRRVNRAITICLTDNPRADNWDEALRNLSLIFDDDSTAIKVNKDVYEYVVKYNKVKVVRNTFTSEAIIVNNQFPNGTRVAIGVFGMVIPTINTHDLLMDFGEMRKEIGQQIIELKLESAPRPELNSVGLFNDSTDEYLDAGEEYR